MSKDTVKAPPFQDQLVNTKWQRPEYTLPVPQLKFLFHLECNMESFKHVGAGPQGDRSTVIFKGGRFEGPDLRGEILPGGGGNPSPPNNSIVQTNAIQQTGRSSATTTTTSRQLTWIPDITSRLTTEL